MYLEKNSSFFHTFLSESTISFKATYLQILSIVFHIRLPGSREVWPFKRRLA